MRPLAFWDCGFDSRWGHECLSLSLSLSLQCYGLSSLSSDHSSGAALPSVGVTEYNNETSVMRRLRPIRFVEPRMKKLRNAISWFQPKTTHTLCYLNGHVTSRRWKFWLARL